MNRETYQRIFEVWCKKLRLSPDWDVRLEWVEDPDWHKTGDFKVDCGDKKAILMLSTPAIPSRRKIWRKSSSMS